MLTEAWCPLGKGSWPPASPQEGCPLTPTPLPPSPDALELCQRNSFHLLFSYKRPSCHRLSYKNQSPSLEFEKRFPRINGKGFHKYSLKKQKQNLVLNRLSFQFLLFLCSWGPRLEPHGPAPGPPSPCPLASFTAPGVSSGWGPVLPAHRRARPALPRVAHCRGWADTILVGTQSGGSLEVIVWDPASYR